MADGSMVERLTAKSSKHKWGPARAGELRTLNIEVRWWLNAIADELDESEDDALEHVGHYEPSVFSGEVAARWLRAQANTDD